MSDGIFLTDDYQGFLSQISTLEKRIQQIISKTCDAVETINTDYDLLETGTQTEDDNAENFGEFLLDVVTLGSSKTVRQQINAHQKTSAINSEIKQKIKDCKGAFRPLYKYLPNMDGTIGLLATFAGVLDGVYNADASQAENINHILDSYGLISGFTPTYATTNLASIRDNTKKPDLDVREHDSYSVMSLKQAFLGDFSEDQTTAGATIGLILQFVPFVDTACDIRDVAGDGKNIYEYENSNDKSWGNAAEVYGFTALDIAGFIPFFGAVKYVDEISDGVKAVDKVNDTRKAIDKINDQRKNLSKIDDIRDAAKGAEATTDTGKTANKVKDAETAKDAQNTAEAVTNTEKTINKTYGSLIDNGDGTYTSKSGLLYGTGSREGNRANHVLEHTKPNINKPMHTVFDVEKPEDVFDLIDEAYTKKGIGELQPNGYMKYEVNMERNIGTNGEQTIWIFTKGNSNEIITAYPK